jgi:hypothetical protein
MAHERIIGLYERTAAAWDEARRGGPSPPERPHLDAFAAALPPEHRFSTSAAAVAFQWRAT